MGSNSRTGRSDPRDPIVIGLVNNMPDAALRRTEGQFKALLGGSPPGPAIQVRSFFLPDVPRSDLAKAYLHEFHEPLTNLWDDPVDALIVTGAEPRAALLTDEPYWASLTELVDWAGDNTVSTIWSCLAAHAAALYLDGVQRRPFRGKLSGVFGCRNAASHPLLAGMPDSWCVPHSRYNDLPAHSLAERGYQIVSVSDQAGADIFVKQRSSLFVFLQGHPEYDRFALFREYRRDVARFLSGERDIYPEMPLGYFDDLAAAELTAFRQRAVQQRAPAIMEGFPNDASASNLMHGWHEAAVRIFANWVACLAAAKQQRPAPSHPAAVLAMQGPGGL
jgi:homoserine O-succinyltransferase